MSNMILLSKHAMQARAAMSSRRMYVAACFVLPHVAAQFKPGVLIAN
jgi:hypothetical protein